MKQLIGSLFCTSLAFLLASPAVAWHAKGNVYCDANTNQVIDGDDEPLEDVEVTVMSLSGPFVDTDVTDEDGYFKISLPDDPDSYKETLDPATLPGDAAIVIPPSGVVNFTTTDDDESSRDNWLIDSAICRDGDVAGACWLTGGGVKFEQMVGADLAQHGPHTTLGGNVNPGCSPTAGEGGQWNHLAHSDKLHFQGFAIQVVRCGNVPGIEPGSESPVTPFNFIEFEGTGRLMGIKGNKVDLDDVYFFARAEDRNEPGSNGAKDGADIDRYFLHVFTDPGDPSGSTELLFDIDGNPDTVDPKTITGGNLQLHISSCDNPPL